MTIGLLLFLGECSVWTHNYFASIADAIQRVVQTSGYDLVPVNCSAAEKMGSYLNYCRSRNYDALVVMSGLYTDSTLVDLINSEIPLVTIDYEFHHRGAVLSDNLQGMRELVRYAYDRGHRQIAFIHGGDTPVTRDRLASFHATCESLGIHVPAEYVREAAYNDPDSSARETEALLKLKRRPTCIIYPDDYSYMGGFRALRARPVDSGGHQRRGIRRHADRIGLPAVADDVSSGLRRYRRECGRDAAQRDQQAAQLHSAACRIARPAGGRGVRARPQCALESLREARRMRKRPPESVLLAMCHSAK